MMDIAMMDIAMMDIVKYQEFLDGQIALIIKKREAIYIFDLNGDMGPSKAVSFIDEPYETLVLSHPLRDGVDCLMPYLTLTREFWRRLDAAKKIIVFREWPSLEINDGVLSLRCRIAVQ